MKIHQVKTRLVNTYVVEYPDKIFVMDVAVACHRYVLGFIEHELKRDIHDVKLVTCSHDDPDHIGGVRRMAQLCHAEIAIPKHSDIWYSKLKGDPTGFMVRTVTVLREGLRGRMWSMYVNPNRNKIARTKPKYIGTDEVLGNDKVLKSPRGFKRRIRLSGDDRLPGFDEWRVLHTPGHSWDSCCFYHEASGSLLTGDTLLGSAKLNKVVVPSIYANAAHTQETLKTLRSLSVSTVYPGHGSVISGIGII